MNNLLRGAAFFTCFLPSFTTIGYRSRRWMWSSTPHDFSGQRWLVTGASDGIGREIASQAAAAGAEVHAVGRNAGRLEALAQLPGNWVTHQEDLSLMHSVSTFADRVTGQGLSFDVLVNNVGLMLGERQLTDEGLEASFATNVLGHFVLTEALRDRGALECGMVINMSSGGMYNVPLTLENLQGQARYDGMLTYAYQKRAQVVLNEWWRRQGLTSYVMHPGWVDTAGVRTVSTQPGSIPRVCARPCLSFTDSPGRCCASPVRAPTPLYGWPPNAPANLSRAISGLIGLRVAHTCSQTRAGALTHLRCWAIWLNNWSTPPRLNCRSS